MADIRYLITLPDSEDIMVAQSGETIRTYKIKNINLEFESITGANIAQQTKEGYAKGRHLYYPYVQHMQSPKWEKDSTTQVIEVNIPRKRLRAIVVLFREKGKKGDSEAFENANIKNVQIQIEGVANQIYNKGMRQGDIYKECALVNVNEDRSFLW